MGAEGDSPAKTQEEEEEEEELDPVMLQKKASVWWWRAVGPTPALVWGGLWRISLPFLCHPCCLQCSR